MKGILTFFIFILTCSVFSQEYNFRNYGAEQGLAQSYVYSITQDELGYLWIGTGNGLSKFNGLKFENFTSPDSLDDNFITTGICDGKNLLFGQMNGGLRYFDGKIFHSLRASSPSSGPVTQLGRGPDGNIWASTISGGLMKLSKEMTVLRHYSFKNPAGIISFEFINELELLIGTNSGLLLCSLNESGEISAVSTINEIGESKVNSIKKLRNNSGFYIATENEGIYKLILQDKIIKVQKIEVAGYSGFNGIQTIYEDSHENLWIAGFVKGLIKLVKSPYGGFSRINYYNKSNKFISDNVKTVCEDSEGNIWTGNYGEGLTILTPKTFSVYSIEDPLIGNNIRSICFDSYFKWIGTENGLAKIDLTSGKVLTFYSAGNGLPKDAVTAIYAGGERKLWIGTEKNGLFTMDSAYKKLIKYPIGKGELENSITNITGKGEQLWVGTKKGLCSINTASGNIKWFTINPGGLPHNYINSLFIDRIGRLWLSTHSNVLTYIENDKLHKIVLNSGIGNLTLGQMAEDSNSHIWIGSNGNGVYMVNPDSIMNLTVKEGLFSNYCYSLICDSHQNIWVTHKGGLSRIRISDNSIKPIQHIEGSPEYFEFNTNSLAVDKQGKIWFGSDKGLISYDQSMEYVKLKAPILGITSIKINDEEKDIIEKIILAPGNYKIKISFFGVSLKDPSLVTYQYKMDGYDQWSEIDKKTTVTYDHLTEGTYTFILKASSGDGAFCENPLVLNFVIKKPLWKKWWFYLLSFLLLIILAVSYIKRREYTFRVEKKILEEKVIERTYELQRKKDEIEFQRDLINEINANITSSIRYALHIQNAILPPLDLIDKLLPDNFILSLPKDIVSGDFYWLAQKENKIIFTVADCTGHGVPGAFMSLLGITLLNEIVNVHGIIRSDEIVNNLRERVIQSLQQGRKDIPTTNGMDIALCVMDKQKSMIQFTGGMNNLIFIRDGKLEIVKADRFSVCALEDDFSPFLMKEITYKKGDIFYLFTDGFKDQFGGARNKKYLGKKIYSNLLDIHKLPMCNQKQILEEKIKAWMKNNIQTDDITVMGIRI